MVIYKPLFFLGQTLPGACSARCLLLVITKLSLLQQQHSSGDNPCPQLSHKDLPCALAAELALGSLYLKTHLKSPHLKPSSKSELLAAAERATHPHRHPIKIQLNLWIAPVRLLGWKCISSAALKVQKNHPESPSLLLCALASSVIPFQEPNRAVLLQLLQ